jgi:glycosyltransferase involved in cell wall biosynthesis
VTTDVLTRDTPVAHPRPSARGDQPVKILVFNSSLRVGGAESMSIALANALAEEGLAVLFAADSGPLRTNLDRRVLYLATDNANQAPVKTAHEVSNYLRHHRPDIIHSHGATCAVVAALAVRASHAGCIRVLTHHSRVFRRAPRWISGPVMKRCADQYIAISRDKKKDLESLGITGERIALIPNFVDVDAVAGRVSGVDRAGVRRELGIPENARVLVMAGRLLPEKRFDQFVRVAAAVARREKDPPVYAVAVGDGPALDDVRTVARKEGAPATIHFAGYQRDIFRFLAASDCVVFPSAHPEVLPMFLIEAGAAGLPIVCSDIPGNREVVTDNETGRLVAGGIEEYATAVLGLLHDASLARRMAIAAQLQARERFDRRKVAREMIGVYEGLLAARAAPAS